MGDDLMERRVGTISRGIRCPIIRENDNLADIVVESVLGAAESEGFEMRDRDVISMTESIVARAQGNYAAVEAIAEDVKAKLGGETIGVIFPILSRNRFAICLRGIAMGAKKVVLMLSYPSDEVGNALLTYDQLDDAGINPYSDVLTLERYRELFGENKHEFTGVDYVDYYSNIIKEAGAEVEVIFANNPRVILDYTKNVLNCDIHTRARTKRILLANGAERVCGLDDILTASVNGKHQVMSLEINPEAVDPDDVEMLQDMIIAAINEAVRAADTDSANNMSRLTGGLNLGGLF